MSKHPFRLVPGMVMTSNPLYINNDLQIPLAEIQFRFARSGGPGGQHVNRSETQVELLWDVSTSPSLTLEQRQVILAALANRIDQKGVLHVVSRQSRSQERNRQEVLTRFVRILQEALRPQRQRRPTRPSARAKEKRLQQKKLRGQIKRWRRVDEGD